MLSQKLIISSFLIALAFPQLLSAQTTPSPSKAQTSTETPALMGPPQPVGPSPEVVAKASPSTGVLSFLEWKSQRVHEAQQKLEQINKGTPTQVWQEGKSVTDPKPTEQKLNFNVDVALQLNIQDYFSMYLKTLTQEEFKDATKKLSPDEVAELLMAYKNSMEKERKIPLKFSKSSKDNAKSKNSEL